MFKFDHIDLQRTAVSGFGALLFSAACVFGAVGPAKADTPASIGAWQSQVEKQIDLHLAANGTEVINGESRAMVRVTLNADNKVRSARIVQSTGIPALDYEALRTARSVSYPALPARLANQPATIAVQVFFGRTAGAIAKDAAVANAEAARHNERVARNAERTQYASLPQG